MPHTSGPIGIFDSGVGGLAIHRAVRSLLPDEDLIYVADSGHAPYGDRAPDYIAARVTMIADALVARGAQALVVACNTATVTTVAALRARHAVPIVGIEPAIKPAAALTRAGRIVVLATQRTAESAAVAALCARHGGDAQIVVQPCPGLADQVDAGDLDSAQTHAMLRRYLAPAIASAADTVVLGCTHFTFLEARIRALLGPRVNIVEPSLAVARQLARRLPLRRAPAGAGGRESFYTTADTPARVGEVMSRLLRRAVEVGNAGALGLHPPEV